MAGLEEQDWSHILGRIREERCVPFLGAGASLGFGQGPGLPTGGTLAKQLAEECQFPGADKFDLLRVAQYYTSVRDVRYVRDRIREMLLVPGVGPSTVHKGLAGLPFRYVLTTNYDDLMERAFRESAGKSPTVAVYSSDGDATDIGDATTRNPLVYKLHGSLDQVDTMVATEDDVIQFLACLLLGNPPLPPAIRGLFRNCSILFIGYGLKDWNIRVILRALRGRRTRVPDIACFSIQRRPDDPGAAREWERTVAYWSSHEELKCYDTDAVEFVSELVRRYEAGEGKR